MAHATDKQTGLTLKARIVALLALLFVSAQFLGVAHNAAYGEADHGHDGQPCIVASIVKKTADMDVATAPHPALTGQGTWIEATPVLEAPLARKSRTGTIRAPPAFA